MKALFVAWQDLASRSWAPVGRLTREGEFYHFVYTHGAKLVQNFIERLNRQDDHGHLNSCSESLPITTLIPAFSLREKEISGDGYHFGTVI